MQDRYREVSSPGHFLVNSTPLASNDNYATYLSSAVHTPVKRYIPTPPLDQSQYSDPPTLSNPGYHLSVSSTQNSLNQIGSSQTLKPQKSRSSSQHQQQQNSQYRINMKCCSAADKQQITTSTLPLASSNADHYATTPRIRASNNMKSAQQSISNNSNGSNVVACCTQTQPVMNAPYISRDYTTGMSKVITPVNIMNQPDQSCINCRRTTGVHQQTQTGPIR